MEHLFDKSLRVGYNVVEEQMVSPCSGKLGASEAWLMVSVTPEGEGGATHVIYCQSSLSFDVVPETVPVRSFWHQGDFHVVHIANCTLQASVRADLPTFSTS